MSLSVSLHLFVYATATEFVYKRGCLFVGTRTHRPFFKCILFPVFPFLPLAPKVVANCAITDSFCYNRATTSFHQWRDITGRVYGIKFASTDDAIMFGDTVDGIVDSFDKHPMMANRQLDTVPPNNGTPLHQSDSEELISQHQIAPEQTSLSSAASASAAFTYHHQQSDKWTSKLTTTTTTQNLATQSTLTFFSSYFR